EKVEGFFDVCAQAGKLDGHGVLIPAANVEHLMVGARVREAVAADRFRIYAVETVDEALALLSGLPAGERHADDRFDEDSFNRRVADRLEEFARLARKHRDKSESDAKGSEDDARE